MTNHGAAARRSTLHIVLAFYMHRAAGTMLRVFIMVPLPSALRACPLAVLRTAHCLGIQTTIVTGRLHSHQVALVGLHAQGR